MKCKICGNDIHVLLDFGNLPVCHRFLQCPEKEIRFPFALSICNSCTTVQLEKPFPIHAIIPAFDWVTYNEPEKHLDDVADLIQKHISIESKICGISFKDDTLLHRLEKMGFKNQFRIGLSDLGKTIGGVESVQYALTRKKAEIIVEKYGRPDLIIARHILEHTYDIHSFVNTLKFMLADNGTLLFEVPDYTKPFEMQDYSSLWEEHLVYFTQKALMRFASLAGLTLHNLKTYSYPIEDSMVMFVRQGDAEYLIPEREKKRELDRAEKFMRNFEYTRQRIQSFVSGKKRVAVFGAGHTACFLLNIFDLKNGVNCVIDDDENKQGLFMPGSHLPIVSSKSLSEFDLCILCVSPDSEEKIMRKFAKSPIKFLSFSPASDISVYSNLGFSF